MSLDRGTSLVPTLRQPVPDRPLTVLDMVDGSFAIIRQAPKTVLLILSAFVVPTQLIGAFAQRGVLEAFSFDSFEVAANGGDPFSGLSPFGSGYLSLVSTVLGSLILPLAGVALTHLVAGWKLGVDRTAGDCLGFTLRKSHIIFGAWVICKLFQAVATMLLVIPLFFAVGLLMVVAPVIASEDVGPIDAIRRSVDLVRPRMMPTLGLLATVGLISWLLAYPVALMPMIPAFFAGSWGWILLGVLGSIGAMVLMALSVGCAVLLYFDLRGRSEGLDLSLRIARLEAARVD